MTESIEKTGRPSAIPRTAPIIARLAHWRRRGLLEARALDA